jgi:Fic family protein
MVKIKTPPSFNELMNKYGERGELLGILGKINDIRGESKYQKWDKILHKNKNKEDAEREWLSIKFLRQSLFKKIDLLENESFNLIITNVIQQRLHQIDKKAGGNISIIENGLIDRSNQQRYLVHSLISEESISSAQLEGAATTTKVAKKMLDEERAPKNKSERMIINNFLLMKEAIKSKGKKLSLELILEFHKIAVNEVAENNAIAGEFRNTNDITVAEINTGDTLWTPPCFKKLENHIESLSTFANENHEDGSNFIHPVVKGIILHFMIGYIHPFGDGNGRVARAVFYWFMLKSGYWLFEYISISKLLKDASTKYTKSFQYVETDENDLTYFIDYHTKVILDSIGSLTKYIHKKEEEFTKFNLMIRKSKISNNLNFRQIEILKVIYKSPGKTFTVKEIKNRFSVAENTARKDLKIFTKMGVLVERKAQKSKFDYIAVDMREMLE